MITSSEYIYKFAEDNSVPSLATDAFLLKHNLDIPSDNWEEKFNMDPSYIYRVTNLNNSGPGSLIEALNYSGPLWRHVIFDVSGTIKLDGITVVRPSNVKVHGNTSPGGIVITGAPLAFIDISNVSLNHLVFALDTAPSEKSSISWNPIKVLSDEKTCSNFSMDHCAVFGGDDDNDFGPLVHTARKVDLALDGCYVTNCFFGYGTTKWRGNHNFSLAISFGRDIVVNNNVFVHSNKRCPQVFSREAHDHEGGQICGNLLYNYGSQGIGVCFGTFDIVDNLFLFGKNSKDAWLPIKIQNYYDQQGTLASLHLHNNILMKNYTDPGWPFAGQLVDWDLLISDASGVDLQKRNFPMSDDQYNWSPPVTNLATAGTIHRHLFEDRARLDVMNLTGEWIKEFADIGGLPEPEMITRKLEIPFDETYSNVVAFLENYVG